MEFEELSKILGCYVTEDGKVYRQDGRQYPTRIDKHGYPRVSIYNKVDKRTYTFLVHRIVAKHFIPNPEEREIVNHKDFNKTNAAVTNLEWVSLQDNNRHAYEHGVRKFTPRKGGKRDWHGRFTKE